MPVIKYIAQRSLITGHLQGVEYSMEVSAQQLDPEYKDIKSERVSLGGAVETNYHHTEELWRLTMGDFPRTGGEGSLQQINEFVASVRGAEVFVFDAYGTLAAADNEQNVIKQGNGYKPQRIAPGSDLFTVGLVMRVV